jgi:2-hydroxychromene-2-carboxylate isomerase
MSDRPDPPVDAEFFLDPACPWCWITSRWVTNVQAERDYRVRWRFISLKIINEDRSGEYVERHREGHLRALRMMRVLHAVRAAEGNDALARAYTALGTELHVHKRHDELAADVRSFAAECLGRAGLDESYADAVDDDRVDAELRAESAEALSRTGADVGTPIITFWPGTDRERSFFGPVIPRAPRGEAAARLWDAVVTLADSDVAELKRTRRGDIDFD